MSSWIDLGKKQAALFMQDNVTYIEILVTGDCSRAILHTCYNILVRQNNLIPIEQLPPTEKTNLWESGKEFANGRLDEKKGIELVKALYALEYLLNL